MSASEESTGACPIPRLTTRNPDIAALELARRSRGLRGSGAAVPLIASIPLAWLLIGWSVTRVLSGLGNLSTVISCGGALWDDMDASISGA